MDYPRIYVETPLGKVAGLFWDERSGKYGIDWQDVKDGALQPISMFGVALRVEVVFYLVRGVVRVGTEEGMRADEADAWRSIQVRRMDDGTVNASAAAREKVGRKLLPILAADFLARQAERLDAGARNADDDAERAEEAIKELSEKVAAERAKLQEARTRAAKLRAIKPTRSAPPSFIAAPVPEAH